MLYYFLNAIACSMAVTGWQGFKDTTYENFEIKKYLRTYIVSFLLIPLIYFVNSLVNHSIAIPLLFLFSISLERLVGELYKGFIRKKSHKEYIHLIEKLELKLNNSYKRRLAAIFIILGVIFLLMFLNFIL